MNQVQIPIQQYEESSRQRRNVIMEEPKGKQFHPPSQVAPLQEELFAEKHSMIFELQKAVRKGDVDNFVDALKQLLFDSNLPSSSIFNQVNGTDDSLLHKAAYFGIREIIALIGHRFPELLTKIDSKGDTALHIAARAKNYDIIKDILFQYDAQKSKSSLKNKDEEITRLTNEYGNTALHEAVCCKHLNGVRLIFDADKCMAHHSNKSGRSPLNQAVFNADKEIVDLLLQASFPNDKSFKIHHGNSPLHAAIQTRNLGLTAQDTIFMLSGGPLTAGQMISSMILFPFSPRISDKARSIVRGRRVAPKLDRMKDGINSLMLVAILIATVTFAAGFTVPGSVHSSDVPNPHNRGMAVLSKRTMFQIFVVFNTIAMYSSTLGSLVLLWTHVGDIHLVERSLDCAVWMVGMALGSMTLGFMAAVRVVVSNVSWLANVITVLGSIFISLILCIGIFGNCLCASRNPLLRPLFELFLRITILLYGSPGKVTSKKPKK